jgi:hypothetical protein
MQILATAQQGLHQAQGQVDKAAQGIAQTSLDVAGPPPADTVSLSDQMISLMTARNQFEADLGLAHTADTLQKDTLKILA